MRICKLFTAVLLILSYLSPIGATGLAIQANQPGLLILNLQIDSLWVEDGHIYTIPAGQVRSEAGYPQIPHFTEVFVNLPDNANINVIADEATAITNSSVEISPTETAKGMDYSVETANWDGSLYPGYLHAQRSAGSIRGNTGLAISVYPVQVGNNTLLWHRNISLQINWTPRTDSAPQPLSTITLGDLPTGDGPPSGQRLHLPPAYQFSPNLARITVDHDGWHGITAATLQDSGVSLNGIDPGTLQLWNRDEQVLLWLEGAGDGQFNGNDLIVFQARKNPPPAGVEYQNNFYTADNIYWLTWGAGTGLRYVSESVYPDQPPDQVLHPASYEYTRHFERDEYFARLGHMGTHQEWDDFDHFFIMPPIHGGTSDTFMIPINHPYPSNTLRFGVKMHLQGITTGSHNLQAFINGYKIADADWSGQNAQLVSSSQQQMLQNNFLSNGPNQLLITLDGSDPTNRYDQVYLNWVDIEYQRQYQASAGRLEFYQDSALPLATQFEIGGFTSNDILIFKENVSRLQDFLMVDEGGGQFKVIFQDQADSPGTVYHAIEQDSLFTPKLCQAEEPLVDPAAASLSDYLIIAPDSFLTTLQPLAAVRNGSMVDVDDIYRTYSGGVKSPYAIKQFLADCYYHNSPRPGSVLIGMQGGLFGWSSINRGISHYIPAMKIQTFKWGAASSDFWYTLIDGDDLIPEFNIGRLPAASIAELELMVDKVLALENQSAATWQNQLLMIAGYEQTFKNQSESLIASIIEKGIFPSRLNIDEYSEDGPFFGTTDTLIHHFGRGLVYTNFLGHGGGAVWGDRSLMTLEDVEDLTNDNRTPIVTSMTCFTGDVTNPDALGRRLMGYENGGVAGWFGSSGVGWIINDYLLLQPIHRYLFDTEQTIGEIISKAKIEFIATNTAYPDIAKSQLYQFNYSGDPALSLALPEINLIHIQPQDPEPGEELTIHLPHLAPDSVRIQFFNPERIPHPRYPLTLPATNAGEIVYQTADTLAPGNYSLNINWLADGAAHRATTNISLSGAQISFSDITPARPTSLDSISITATISDRQVVDTAELWLNGSYYADLHPNGGQDYSLADPIPPQPAGSTLYLKCRVVDQSDQVTFGPEIALTITTIARFDIESAMINNDEVIQLTALVRNPTNGTGRCVTDFHLLAGDTWQDLGTDTVNFSGPGLRSTSIITGLPAGRNSYRLITRNADYQDRRDTLQVELETMAFWVTPEAGTTTDLATNSWVSRRKFSLKILPGSVASPVIIIIEPTDTLKLNHQPDFSLVQLDSQAAVYDLSIPLKTEISARWTLDTSITADSRLYQYFPKYKIWLPVRESTSAGSTLEFSARIPGKFALLQSSDLTAPELEATVNGQRLLTNSYLNDSPVISLVAQDQNGIDPRTNSLSLRINDIPVSDPPFTHMSGSGNLFGFRLTPNLTAIDTSMAITITDATGNSSDTLKLKFIVSEKLRLVDYGNFPNPFTDHTRFSYELTETVEDFSLSIYTVDGRRIRRLGQQASLTDIDLTVGAYHEIIWDGRDKNGDFVANGVYFYCIKITKDGKTIEKRGKIAKAR